MPELLSEDVDTFVGKKRVTGSISRLRSTFLEVYFYFLVKPPFKSGKNSVCVSVCVSFFKFVFRCLNSQIVKLSDKFAMPQGVT
jgi:hypothetical protein